MLHLTHRTLDVFRQLRHRVFWFILSGMFATLSNLAAVVGSGLLTRLLLVSVFAVAETRPRDFLAYALFTFVKASATSNGTALDLSGCHWRRRFHPFTTATWSVQKKFPCTIFYFGDLSDTMLATSPPNLRRPCICCTLLQLPGRTRRPRSRWNRFTELHYNIKTEAATEFLYSWHFTFIKAEVVQQP
ncbi:hypothetical protein T02_11025 [Trichinella nativa]|uniref:Uncharacterized protein n=1 Tax=Trichinella nativa TaxID=6335 RepID=A0A0V1LPY8_9BILA|nr:hypothetical protein T02_11025 [Trichinella nativa]